MSHFSAPKAIRLYLKLSSFYDSLSAPFAVFTPGIMSNATTTSQAASTSPSQGVSYQPSPGHLGNLTELQQQALETLKEELQNNGHFVAQRMDDATLLRYISYHFVHWRTDLTYIDKGSSVHASLMSARQNKCYLIPRSGGKSSVWIRSSSTY